MGYGSSKNDFKFDYLNSQNQLLALFSLYNYITSSNDGNVLANTFVCVPGTMLCVSLADINEQYDVVKTLESILNKSNDEIYELIRNNEFPAILFLLATGFIKVEEFDKIYIDIDVYSDKLNDEDKLLISSYIARVLNEKIAKYADKERIKAYSTPSKNLRLIIDLSDIFDFNKIQEIFNRLLTIKHGNDSVTHTSWGFRKLITFPEIYALMINFFDDEFDEFMRLVLNIKKTVINVLRDDRFTIPVSKERNSNINNIIIGADYVINFKGHYYIEGIFQPRKGYVNYKLEELDLDSIEKELDNVEFIKPKSTLIRFVNIRELSNNNDNSDNIVKFLQMKFKPSKLTIISVENLISGKDEITPRVKTIKYIDHNDLLLLNETSSRELLNAVRSYILSLIFFYQSEIRKKFMSIF